LYQLNDSMDGSNGMEQDETWFNSIVNWSISYIKFVLSCLSE
jgi:hypothetical protein